MPFSLKKFIAVRPKISELVDELDVVVLHVLKYLLSLPFLLRCQLCHIKYARLPHLTRLVCFGLILHVA
jgi:hypothetical protein